MTTHLSHNKQHDENVDDLSILTQQVLALAQRLLEAREIKDSVRKNQLTQRALANIQALLIEKPELLALDDKSLSRFKNQKALAEAKARGDLIKEHLIASKELVAASELAVIMGVSMQALNKGKKSKYFALNVAGKDYYPAFFADGEISEMIKSVLTILKDEEAWSKWIFLTSPSGFLAQERPIDVIRKGNIDAVKKAARGHVER